MPAPAFSTERVQFGVFELDLQKAELRKQGVKVKLQEQPLKVLQVLLENQGQIVTRDELRKRVWPADTFVEFDQGLYSAMARLRDALGDSSESPRFVETVARRGYRFIAPVTELPAQGVKAVRGDKAVAYRRLLVSLVAGLLGGAILILTFLLFDAERVREWFHKTPIRSIAVLPLENLSHDPEQEYFADGMTDELITSLAKLGNLRVVSRTSAMHYKKTSKPLPEIGRELNVDAVVEGTVERSGNRVRIRVQLIQASSDRHMWAQTYDRELGDTLLLQSEASADIVREIQSSLTPSQQERVQAARKIDPEAYEDYLKGMYFSNKRSAPNFTRAMNYFQQAIANEPRYAAAYSGLSDALIGLIFTGTPSKDVRQRATWAADKSIELDPEIAEAHASSGTIRELYDWDWVGAEREYRRAIELNQNFARAHQEYALFLAMQGRFDQSMSEAQRAQDLDPLSPFVRTTYCLGLGTARRYQEAVKKCQEALELDPNFLHAHGNLAGIYESMGVSDRAVEEYQIAAKLRGEDSAKVTEIKTVFQQGGMQALWRKWVSEEPEGTGRDDPVETAAIYSLLSEKDRSFASLEQAYQERSPLIEFLKEDSDFDNIRPDPRYREMLRRIGMDN